MSGVGQIEAFTSVNTNQCGAIIGPNHPAYSPLRPNGELKPTFSDSQYERIGRDFMEVAITMAAIDNNLGKMNTKSAHSIN